MTLSLTFCVSAAPKLDVARTALRYADAELVKTQGELGLKTIDNSALSDEARLLLDSIHSTQSKNDALQNEIGNYKSWAETEQKAAAANALGWQKAAEKGNSATLKLSSLEKRVNSMFGLGAIFYGLQRILTFGIFGGVALAVAAVILFFVCPTALWSLIGLFRRKP